MEYILPVLALVVACLVFTDVWFRKRRIVKRLEELQTRLNRHSHGGRPQ